MENWKTIPDFPGYEVSDLGRVRSVDRVVQTSTGARRYRGQIIKPHAHSNGGRAEVRLSVVGGQRTTLVAPLVLSAFVGPRPPGMEACHNDGDPTSDRLDNLRWDTHAANVQDSVRHGTNHNASKTRCKHGHPFDEANTRVDKRGKRSCKTCELDHLQAYVDRQRRLTDVT